MSYKRIHVRVPIEAEAFLSSGQTPVIKAKAIDISHGGVAVTDLSTSTLPEADYRIEVTIQDGRKVDLAARLVRQTIKIAAFQAFYIDQKSWQIIKDLVFSYQETDDFIRQMEEYRLLDNYLVDESGAEIDISFDVDPRQDIIFHAKIEPVKTKTFQITNNRIQFKCAGCATRRMLTVPPNLRRKRVKCHRCEAYTNCLLNRRSNFRDLQSGKVLVVTESGDEIEAFLNDVSHNGVGFSMLSGSSGSKQLTPGRKVRFKCGWNSQLLGNNSFIIRSIKGQKIGAQKLL